MLISIVTAIRNRRQTIGSAIESLRSQTYAEYEHVVQDGASTDGSIDLIRSTADHRTVLESAPDSGIYDALNKGIARATGEVVGILHSDDMFASPDVLAKVAAAFADESVDAVYGDLQYVSSTAPEVVVRHWTAGVFSQRALRRGWMPPHPTLFLRRRVFEQFGSYDTSFQIAGDYDAILRWFGAGRLKAVYIPEVLVRMRLGGESNRSIERLIRKSREDLLAARRNGVGGVGTLVHKNLRKVGQFTPLLKRWS